MRTMPPLSASGRVAPLLPGLVLGVLYYLACAFSALTIHDPQSVALFWPASGIALGGLMRFGLRQLWFVPLALLVYHATLSPVPPVFLLFSLLANTLGAVVGVVCARRAAYRDRVETHSALLVLLGGVVLAAVCASIGVVGMRVAGMIPDAGMGAAWVYWMLGNLLGVAAFGPAVMLVPLGWGGDREGADTAREPERMLWLIALAASFLLLAWAATAGRRYALGLTALPLAVLTWSAIRFRTWWTALGTLATSALIGILAGFGLAGFTPPREPLEAAQLLGFLIVIAVLPVVVALSAHDRRMVMRRLLRNAATDPITGLPNRTAFEQAVRERLADPTQPPRALAYLDLDHLKLINDTASHRAGDALIHGIGGVLQAAARPHDLIGHLGGDEFAILMHNVLPAAAEDRARWLLREIGSYRCQWNHRPLGTTASIGLVPFHDEHTDFAQLLSQADAACFTAKQSGGDQVCRASLVGGGRFDHTREMRSAIRAREAVEHGRLVLFAQAIVPLEPDGSGRHFEVLLRVRDGISNELLPPAQFFAAAGRFRLGVLIDREVVRLTLDWLERHADPADVDMCSVNLSAESLADESFMTWLSDRLHRSSFPIDRLCLEITETGALRDVARVQRFIAQMRALGCRFAIDDFGTGFSSFSHLRSLDVDYFKIDGSFVRDLDSSPLSLPIVRAITDIAHTLDRRSVAEHAETPEQIAALLDLGVDLAQGYVIHRPEPIEQYFARPACDIMAPRAGRH